MRQTTGLETECLAISKPWTVLNGSCRGECGVDNCCMTGRETPHASLTSRPRPSEDARSGVDSEGG